MEIKSLVGGHRFHSIVSLKFSKRKVFIGQLCNSVKQFQRSAWFNNSCVKFK